MCVYYLVRADQYNIIPLFLNAKINFYYLPDYISLLCVVNNRIQTKKLSRFPLYMYMYGIWMFLYLHIMYLRIKKLQEIEVNNHLKILINYYCFKLYVICRI